MKLILGCGKNVPDGYLGVDLDPSVKPDILDNIVTLTTLRGNTADEIKSVHSFEHLSYYDAVKAVSNWYRVLKDGGVLSIEMPDLDKCVSMMKSDDPEERQLGVNGLYGEPGHKFLSHRYGWNAEMLKKLMESAGFVDVKQATLERVNKCTGKFDRDMRLIGVKS